ncbi:hypothetical protein [Salegentibacter sp.]|uniref:hypothetical protein n=1 Tax=Salegentibacter sp. TaxID=1903072 RepID=UPI003563CEF5
MMDLEKFELEPISLESFIIGLNLVIFLVAVSFLMVTFIKRLKRINEDKRKKEYQAILDSVLFEFLFDDKKVEEVIKAEAFKKNLNSVLFKRVAIRSVLSLHQSYSGNYSRKLEEFYEASGLVNYSLEKLNASSWTYIVEGIRDLSGMNFQKAYPRIVSYKNHDNKMVRTEVLLGMIKLKGIGEILKFSSSELYMNEWVQSNILYTVKKHKIGAPSNLLELLQSKNRSVVLLAVRLINYYNSIEHYPALSKFYQQTKDVTLRREIAGALRKTEQIS